MKIKKLHPWKVMPDEALEIQRFLKERVSLTDDFPGAGFIETVAGVDVCYKKDSNRAVAAAVVLSFPELEILDSAVVEGEVGFPYIPGLFSFREIPLLIPALEKLKVEPCLVMADGQGIAHPQRFGLASHLGVLTGIPTVGCARSRLIGIHKEPSAVKGAFAYLYDKGEAVGAVVRTRAHVSPLYVSCGYGISLETAVDYVLKCCIKFRLPEPLRSAHHLSRIWFITTKTQMKRRKLKKKGHPLGGTLFY
jgi:deoxyribonuclease V